MISELGSCRFDSLSIFINFMFFSSVFPVEPENDIRLFGEIKNNIFYSTLNSIFPIH